jgi:vacuolar-type H+-ATPase subunit E/Vma4
MVMDSAMEAKLSAFSSRVLSLAKKRSDETDEKTNEIRKAKTEKKQDEFLEDAYRAIQSGVAKIRRTESEKVLRAENDMKKEILSRREEIINSVFSQAKEELSKFSESEEYRVWFDKKLSLALEGTGEGKKTVYVLEKDKKEAEKSGEKVVVVNEAGFIGGVRVVNDDLGIIADYSFGEELSEAKEDFLQKSSLSIE